VAGPGADTSPLAQSHPTDIPVGKTAVVGWTPGWLDT
jgi:hypothetical protein